MEKKANKPVGTIKVSESVIVKMAELAAAEIDGVYCRGQAPAPSNTKSKVLVPSVQGWARTRQSCAWTSSSWRATTRSTLRRQSRRA